LPSEFMKTSCESRECRELLAPAQRALVFPWIVTKSVANHVSMRVSRMRRSVMEQINNMSETITEQMKEDMKNDT